MLLLSSLIFCYKALLDAMFVLDFPGDSASKGLTCQGRQCGFISWVEKFPWRRKWQPTPVFFLGNPIEKGAWQAAVHRVTKSQTRLRRGAQRSNRVCVTGSFRVSHDDWPSLFSVIHNQKQLNITDVHTLFFKFLENYSVVFIKSQYFYQLCICTCLRRES